MTTGGLIISIGVQNTFVLKQGLQKNHTLTIAMLCSIFDALLILVGIAGFGSLLTSNDTLLAAARWGGVVFLVCYGLRSFYSAWKKDFLPLDVEPEKIPLRKAILILLACTFLNPQVFMENCILIGSIGAQYVLFDRYFFSIGAIAASFAWFFSLSYGARYLIPFFKKPVSWKVLDFIVGCIMFAIAIMLATGVY